MKLRELVYPIYEARIRRSLKGRPQPKHVAIMADGNRRWAREAGFTDISQGHRRGAHKIAELVSWCAETEVEVVTCYLLSTENLRRAPEELNLLFDIITDVVVQLAQGNQTVRFAWWAIWICYQTRWPSAWSKQRQRPGITLG